MWQKPHSEHNNESMIAIFKGGVLANYKNTWDSGHYFSNEFNIWDPELLSSV